jgi:hypothetical protein
VCDDGSCLPTTPSVETLDYAAKPLRARDYRWAVLHLAWHRRGQQRTLLFGFVELLPTEVPAPFDDGEKRTRISDDDYLYVHHVVTTAERAMAWYRDCADGVVVRPTTEGMLRARSPDVETMASTAVHAEPPWPNMVLARSTDVLPFLPNSHFCPRVHHLVPDNFDVTSLFGERTRERAEHWLADHLHFSFVDHPTLWGSLHLVAPNPVFRAVYTRLEERGHAESVFVYVQPRAGQSTNGLRLRFVERRPTGDSICADEPIRGDGVALTFDHILEEHTVEVRHEERGVLWSESPSVFLKQIRFSVALSTVQRIVQDEAGTVLEVPLVSDSPASIVNLGGRTDPSRATDRLRSAAAARRQRSRAEELTQRWFDDDRPAAERAIQDLIRAATSSVMVVDQYFRRSELKFVLVVPRARVPIRILSGRRGLVERDPSGVEAGDALRLVVDRLTSSPDTNPIDVRVMPGTTGVHDRFIVVDGVVFLLGSSLNEFGTRGTMLLRVPDPEPIAANLEDAWTRAKSLAEWTANRAQTRSSGSDETE